ncbi:ileal sodium/bile acid cotransporter-like [Diadema antillarum]|uniref:ileal sodium/bile acid cotransporter-like n=1 Tax=Diadema antillarum TaxID=105358 RepID=UPI003A871C7B
MVPLENSILEAALILLLVFGGGVHAQSGAASAVNISYIEDTVYVFEGHEANVTVTVHGIIEDGVLTFRSSSVSDFILKETNTIIPLSRSDDFPMNVTVTIEGKFISLATLDVLFDVDGDGRAVMVGSQKIGVKRVPTLIRQIYVYVLLIWLILSYLSMGGGMEVGDIWRRVRRPWGILIGLVCQFVIMPASTFVIALLLARDDAPTALGIVLVGTSPGGWLSNIFSVLLDVDLVLSITMTFCSTVLALAMMPLNLYIYATPFIAGSSRLQTPFRDLAQQILYLVVPCFVGMALSHKFQKFKKLSRLVIKPIAILLIIIAIGLAVPSDFYAFARSPFNNWMASIVVPGFGAFLGLSVSRIFGRDVRTSVTIALETGIQNGLLGLTIVALFYPQPEADLLARVILTIALVTICEGSAAVFIYSIFRYWLCRKRLAQISAGGEEGVRKDGRGGSTAVEDDVLPRNGATNVAFEIS